MKAVFDTKPGSGYDDEIQTRYHFPNKLLPEAQKTVGDWIVYRATRRGGGKIGYFAVARVVRIDPDEKRTGHSYARMADYLPFGHVVPMERPRGFYEEQLQFLPQRSLIGSSLRGKSVRTISESDFAAIALAGLGDTLAPENAIRLELDDRHADPETLGLLQAPHEEQERRIIQILVNRKIREASFRRQVIDAYDHTCAVTRLRIINGGGKAEAQAAHIWSVASGGPDVVQNGIALSATAHWLFDRHLISLTDDYGLLVSHNRVPSELRPLFENQLKRIHLPKKESMWPHPEYVRRHRASYMAH